MKQQLVQPNKKGQIVIPSEYRKKFGITENTTLNVYPMGQKIIIETFIQKPHSNFTANDYMQFVSDSKGAFESVSKSEKSKESKLKKAEKLKTNKNKQTW